MTQPYEVFSSSVMRSYLDEQDEEWSTVESRGTVGFMRSVVTEESFFLGYIPSIENETVQERHERFLKYLSEKEQAHA